MQARLILALIALLARLPLSVSRGLGVAIGELLYRANGRNARVTRTNLRRCLTQLDTEAVEKLTRQHLHHLGQMMTETGAVWRGGLPWIEARVRAVHGEQRLDADPSGAGTLLLVPHAGNWEVAGIWASDRRPTTAIYKTPKIAGLDPLLRSGRNIGGTTLVPADRQGVLAVLRALGRGEMSVLLPDQEPAREGGQFAPFFGIPALTMTLVPKLVKKTGCRVVLGLARRVPGGFELHYLEPDSRIYAEDEQEALTGLNASVEQIARLAPEQYQWEYKRFRRRPEGEPPFYVT